MTNRVIVRQKQLHRVTLGAGVNVTVRQLALGVNFLLFVSRYGFENGSGLIRVLLLVVHLVFKYLAGFIHMTVHVVVIALHLDE